MTENFAIQFFLPLFFALGFYLSPSKLNEKKCKTLSVFGAFLCLVSTINFIVSHFPHFSHKDLSTNKFILYYKVLEDVFGISYLLSLDRLGSLFLLVNSCLLMIIVLSTFNIRVKRLKLYYFLIFFSYWIANAIMYSENLYSYYLFWEMMMLPLFLLTGSMGREKRMKVCHKTFIYFSLSSVIMLSVIMYMSVVASGHYTLYHDLTAEFISGLPLEFDGLLSPQSLVFWGITLALLIRMPVFPFHSWAADFEDESPIATSVMTRGFLITIGMYGLMKFVIPVFSKVLNEYGHFIIMVSIGGVLYCALTALRQTRIKKLFTYASLAQASLVISGLFTLNKSAMAGAVFYAVNHIFVTSGIFALIHYLSIRKVNESISEYRKMAHSMPLYSILFFILLISFIPLPLTSGFKGSFLIIMGLYEIDKFIGLLAMLGISFCIICLLRSFPIVVIFQSKDKGAVSTRLEDLKGIEIIPMILLILFVVTCTLFPHLMMNYIRALW